MINPKSIKAKIINNNDKTSNWIGRLENKSIKRLANGIEKE